ncbi:lipoyl(octanoyl) transferase LipB [Leptothoe kymatousa]|uniref:Octanoyltransferase n=1 Tax=Leptothoe kymatousa TAU-MAC 1615 TaxID=2364775 RepID=A0ABS5Y0L3_9CYAN|nr:lipoyl(octanoyl) transferase LipB [Leptothoe kymatousa]MBT9311348.1 lipoyl(octanoyl) transferase LipB [Leptothoe kymatousa TAU-MAC 1615]
MVKDRKLIVQDLGLIEYKLAWKYQQELVSLRKTDSSLNDILLLAEHPPVYTLGTGSNTQFVHFDLENPEYDVYRVERGGEVTYHCPGQLVGYPILNLNHHQRDLHWYLRQLEESLIKVLAHYQIQGQRVDGMTGVWVEDYKVAAIGIKVSRWITMHGFALNVCPDLSGFKRITPCGIADRPVGSMAQFLANVAVADVKPALIENFAQVFQLHGCATNGSLAHNSGSTNNRKA